MKHLIAVLGKWTAALMAFAKPFGVWGMGALATIDAAGLPLPMDLIMATYAWANRQDFYLYAILAGAGSALGALVPYFIGRGGGELFLLRRVNRAKFERVRTQFEKHEFAAMTIASAMPWPMPWKLFVFGAGVFEMRMLKFMLAVFVGRTARYLVEGVLTVLYGPQIITLFKHTVKTHLVAVVVATVLVGVAVWWLIRRQIRKRGPASE